MAKKRKHAEASTVEPSSSVGKERQSSGSRKDKDALPKAVSSNWMQLQAVGVAGPS